MFVLFLVSCICAICTSQYTNHNDNTKLEAVSNGKRFVRGEVVTNECSKEEMEKLQTAGRCSSFTTDDNNSSIKNLPKKFPLCVGIRGNGARLWAHFTALARIVEQLGPVDIAVGGSSSTVAVFILESIQSNPLVANSCKGSSSSMEQRARISFLLKSIQTLFSLDLNQTAALSPLVEKIVNKDIPTRLQSSSFVEQAGAVKDLLLILMNSEIDGLINPEVTALLAQSPNPVFHAMDILNQTLSLGSYQTDTGPEIFVRPTVLNFDSISEGLDVFASFYIGYEPVNHTAMEYMLENCATEALGMDWPDAKNIRTPSNKTCGELFFELLQDFINVRNSSDHHSSRLDEPLGTSSMYSIVPTSALTGDAVDSFDKAKRDYYKAKVPITWDVDFDDVKIPYWGNAQLLNRVRRGLAENFNDIKSRKFVKLGQSTWKYVLQRSPAEPGLSAGLPTKKKYISTGGWAEHNPGPVLQSAGCETILLINRNAGFGYFSRGLSTLLGATEADLNAFGDLSNEESSWTTALQVTDAVVCTNWDAYNQTDFSGLSAEGWNAPLITSNECIRPLFPNASANLTLPGCTPFVEERQPLR